MTRINLFHKLTINVFLICSLLFSSCSIDPDFNSAAIDLVGPNDLVSKVQVGLVSGFVTDENDAPILSASVEIGGTITTTDKYGYFEVKNALVVQNAATLSVNKSNYFKAIKTFIGTQSKCAFFRIKLLPKTIAGTINSSTGGSVILSNGLMISLPANAIVNASSNSVYNGVISVAAQLISATDPDLDRIMPGDLRGLNSNNELQLLTTFGMAAVELIGAGGQLLQVATNQKAKLTIPLSSSQQSSAPANIPLWYFNENNGLWKEEGSAVKTGNTYVGEVSHFSYWNCDSRSTYIHFDCTLINLSGRPVPNAFVKVSRISYPASAGFGYTDSTGYTGGAVPDNEQLLLQVYDGAGCNVLLYSQPFTTLASNISLGIIIISNPLTQINISGSVTDCNFLPITNGTIILSNGTRYFHFPVINGAFNFFVILCTLPNRISLVAEDLTNRQQSQTFNFVIHSGNNPIGIIQACGVSTQQFLYYTINGTSYSYTAPPDNLLHYLNNNISVSWDEFSGRKTNLITSFPITHPNIAAGSIQQLRGFYNSQFVDSFSLINPVPVNITEYGSVNQFISGNFSGTLKSIPPGTTLYDIVCSFRVRRSQ